MQLRSVGEARNADGREKLGKTESDLMLLTLLLLYVVEKSLESQMAATKVSKMIDEILLY